MSLSRATVTAAVTAALAAVVVTAGGAGAATPTASRSATIIALPGTALTTETFSVNGQLLPVASPVGYQVQVETPDRRTWRTVATGTTVQYLVVPLHFTSPNVYSVRLVVPAATGTSSATSATKTVTVTPPYPYTSLTRRTFDLHPDAKTEQKVTVGHPIVEATVTNCSIPNLPGSCVTDTPANGRFVTVPLSIHQIKGRSSFAPYNYVLTVGRKTYSPVFEPTPHGAALSPGSQRAGGTTNGTVVFDAPLPTGARFSILGVPGSLKL